MAIGTVRLLPPGWTEPQIPEFCGPTELADIVLHFRSMELSQPRTRVRQVSPLSDDGVRKLLRLAYHTSQMPEEGRFLRFRVVCPEEPGPPAVNTFLEPLRLRRVDDLRRLAPACAHQDCALLIAERDGRLWCNGVAIVGSLGLETKPGRPEFDRARKPPALVVSVEGPGHIVVDEIMSYELRGGRVRQIVPFSALPPMARFLGRTAQIISQGVRDAGEPDFDRLFGGEQGMTRLVREVLSRCLRSAVEARHGGSFVILPCDCTDPEPFNISCKYCSHDLDMGAELADFWRACIRCARARSTDEFAASLEPCAIRRSQLMAKTMALADLSCIDGCVVLNKHLQLCGFGGEIRVTDEQAKNSPLQFRNVRTGKAYEHGDYMHMIGGTRHRSAARLCRAFDNTVAFVISQDGELRVLFSDSDVYGFGPMDPS